MTVGIILFLLNMSYQNTVSYLPALVLLCNIVILLALRYNPQFLEEVRSAARASARSRACSFFMRESTRRILFMCDLRAPA